MTISRAIRDGVSATWRNKWMVLLFFACNLLMAAAIAAPMHAAMADHLGNSAVSEQMARGFDWGWLAEFQISHESFLKSLSTAIVYGSLLFLVVNTLLSAGAFELYRRRLLADAVQEQASSLRIFGAGLGGYFLRFARVVIIASFFYFFAFWLWQGPALDLLDRIFEDAAVERWHFYLNCLRLALMFLSVITVNIVVDYAKADLVIDNHFSALGAIGHAAGFVVANFGRVVTIYLALGICSALTVLVYAAFARFFPQSSAVSVFVWFLVAQLLLWLRWMFRLSSWGAAVGFYVNARQPVTQIETISAAG